MKIGILGSGNMGRCLGMVWAEKGHDIFYGDKEVDKAQAVAEFVKLDTKGGTIEEAAAHGQVLLHTARDALLSSMLQSTDIVHNKIIIDCNNASSHRLFKDRDLSHAQRLSASVPLAHVVKAFNTIPQELFEYCPDDLVAYKVSCFVCGDSEFAVKIVMDLAREIGFDPIHCGSLRNAQMLETFGDFIRIMIKEQNDGPFCAISFQQLPQISNPRLGGRNPILR